MISVIIPIYNAAPYLRRCLDSVKAQTYTEWEGVLIDDGSSDGSAQIAEEYAKADNRFHTLHQTNRGQAAARNAGISQAQGDYVLFIDADDYVDADYLSQMMDAIVGVDVVQTGYRRVQPDGKVKETQQPTHFYNQTSACMRLYRRHLFDNGLRFTEGMYYEDVIFSVRLWQQKPTYRILANTGYNYIINPQSTTSTLHQRDAQKALLMLREMSYKGPRRWVACWTRARLFMHFILNKH
ncbi:MAG: glycosyltransferase [Paludibacteraceae bacterium]|nr:glycosyltransferase [Paludibacteraceae bacterium]